jgi:hypothetical protein
MIETLGLRHIHLPPAHPFAYLADPDGYVFEL